MDWSDLRVFLAVAELGSLRQAALRLGVTQPTVARRIRALEADLGLPLFERERDGHRLTRAGAELLPDARAVETAAIRVERRSLDLLAGLTETVRVEAMETAAAVFARGLASLGDGPAVEIAVTGVAPASSDRMPEIMVRHGLPASGDGITRRLGSISSAVYGAPQFAEGRALPLAQSELAALPWLGYVEEQDHYVTMRWLNTQMRGRPPAGRMMRTDLLAAAAASGVGVAVLPQFMARETQRLVRLTDPIEELRADYWAVVHPDLSRSPAIRAVLAWMAECFRLAEYGSPADAPQPAA